MNFKPVVIALVVGLIVSMIFNIYFFTRPSKTEQTYVADVHITDFDWTETLQDATINLYYVHASFKLVNHGNSTADVVVMFSVLDAQGNIVREPGLDVDHSIISRHVCYYGYFIVTSNTYSFDFNYLKPQGIQTHVKAEIHKTIVS